MSELETKLEESKKLLSTIGNLQSEITSLSFGKYGMNITPKSLMPTSNGRNSDNVDRIYKSLKAAEEERQKKYDDILKSLAEKQEKMRELMDEKRILDNDITRLQKQEATAQIKSLKTAKKAAEAAAKAANTRTPAQKAANTRAASKAAQDAKNALKTKTPGKSRRNTRRKTRRH